MTAKVDTARRPSPSIFVPLNPMRWPSFMTAPDERARRARAGGFSPQRRKAEDKSTIDPTIAELARKSSDFVKL